MSNQLYPSDLTDREWEYIKATIPPTKSGGRDRKTDMRQVVNAVFYISRAGCAWRYLPREYPTWQTVYGYFRRWRTDDMQGFVVLPRRWVVERTFGWISFHRRLSKDYEYLPATSETFIYISMIRLMLARVT